jgi:hypothetical protein
MKSGCLPPFEAPAAKANFAACCGALAFADAFYGGDF